MKTVGTSAVHSLLTLVFRAQYPSKRDNQPPPITADLLATMDKDPRRELAGNNAIKHKVFEWEAPIVLDELGPKYTAVLTDGQSRVCPFEHF
jgi:hypothetical protein